MISRGRLILDKISKALEQAGEVTIPGKIGLDLYLTLQKRYNISFTPDKKIRILKPLNR